jgi:hypothetical protein
MNPPTATSGHAELLAGAQLERRLQELLQLDRFAPPVGFVATELVNEASLYRTPRSTSGSPTAS